MKAITARIRATGLTMAPGRITAEAQSWWQLAIGRTIAVPDIGTAAYIMFGSLVTGRGDMVSACGFAGITWREDINPRSLVRCLRVGGLPGCDQPAQQTEKSTHERFRKIVAL